MVGGEPPVDRSWMYLQNSNSPEIYYCLNKKKPDILFLQEALQRNDSDYDNDIEILKEALVQVFTNDRFMVNQLKRMNTMDTNNEYDLKRALENIKQLNIICESIYTDE